MAKTKKQFIYLGTILPRQISKRDDQNAIKRIGEYWKRTAPGEVVVSHIPDFTPPADYESPNWENLKEHRCVICGEKLYKISPEALAWQCECGWRIANKRLNKVTTGRYQGNT